VRNQREKRRFNPERILGQIRGKGKKTTTGYILFEGEDPEGRKRP